MKTIDIGFERFEEDFYADPRTMFVKIDKAEEYKKALENIGMLDLDKESNGYDNPKYLKDFYFGEYCILQELVEKATPKKPLEVCEYDFDVYLFGKCPVCGEGCNNGMNYCDTCGQALDWSEEDE